METSVISVRGKKHEYGVRLERPAAEGIVYVGRRMTMGGWDLPHSPFANPFTAKNSGSLQNILMRYHNYVVGNPELLRLLPTLRGKKLGCWCYPKPCHATVLKELLELMDSGKDLYLYCL